jgi:hypothetical protein
MKVEQLFVETLIDIDKKLRANPSEYDLLKVAGLLRPILLDKPPFLDTASATTGIQPKFRVVKPAPLQLPPEYQRMADEAWAKLHATRPDIKRVDLAVGMRGGLLTGEATFPGDQVLEVSRVEFLKHDVGFTLNDVDHTVEGMLRLVANSLGGIHNDGKPNKNPEAEVLRQYEEQGGAKVCGRSLPAARMFEIAQCTLRACHPIANELAKLGLYVPASSEWEWSVK